MPGVYSQRPDDKNKRLQTLKDTETSGLAKLSNTVGVEIGALDNFMVAHESPHLFNVGQADRRKLRCKHGDDP